MKCKNCGEEVLSNYCGHCGQDIKVGNITWSKLLAELSESIFQLNQGFLFTSKELWLKPGLTIRNYLIGKRKKYVKPIAYLLVTSTIYFLVSGFIDYETWLKGAISGFYLGAQDVEGSDILPPVMLWIAENYAYAALLLIPLFSLASFLSFYKYKHNYLEHVVLNSFIVGQQAIIYTFFALLNALFSEDLFGLLAMLLSALYCCFVFIRFFGRTRWKVILLSVLTYIVYFLFTTLILGGFIAN